MQAGELLDAARRTLTARRVSEALEGFLQARSLGASLDECDAGAWECLMLLGRYEEAWERSDAIERRGLQQAGDRFWDGRPLAGRHVMLRCLHGFGDALQFIRYAPQLCAQAASLCVECHPEMLPLLAACDGVERVITWGEHAPTPAPHWDAQVEIMELPRLFRATPQTIPRTFPYLHPSRLEADRETEKIVHTMQARRAQGRLQVGFSWRSSGWNPLRSLPFGELLPAFEDAASADLYSLQPDGFRELETENAPSANVEAAFPQLALRMAALDCVVTVDGVLAHLAGALGLPVLLLLPHAADWRWGLENTTPWYPRTRLFRQAQPGNWRAPLAGVRAALQHLTKHDV